MRYTVKALFRTTLLLSCAAMLLGYLSQPGRVVTVRSLGSSSLGLLAQPRVKQVGRPPFPPAAGPPKSHPENVRPLMGHIYFDFDPVPPKTCLEVPLPVEGANPGDYAYVPQSAMLGLGLSLSAHLNETDSAILKICNSSDDRIDPPADLYAVVVKKMKSPLKVYEVGPDRQYTSIAKVPWDTLSAGSEVRIHWRPEPYREKWHVGRSGTASAPIRIVGVRGPLNERPVIEAEDAVPKMGQDYWNEDRGLIKIGGPSIGKAIVERVMIAGLELRGARLGKEFHTLTGGRWRYLDNAAGIYIEGPAAHIEICDNFITDNGTGVFASNISFLALEGNYLHWNGYKGSSQHHNSYIQGYSTLYQFNRYELREGQEGNNLKDRGAASIISYNQLIDGNRCLDLVDGSEQGKYEFPTDFVYGNLLVKGSGFNNDQIVHYGWDVNATLSRRKLLFYHNTVIVSRGPGNNHWVGIKVDNDLATVKAQNNIFYYERPGQVNSYYGGDVSEGPGSVSWTNSWFFRGDCSNTKLFCTRPGDGFADEGGNRWSDANPLISVSSGFILSQESPLLGIAASLPESWPPITAQFPGLVRDRAGAVGAFEYAPR